MQGSWSVDMILVSQERRRLQEERQELIDRVTKFYFERKAASERLKRQGLNRGERLKLETLILDRAARLDADTGGWFHAAMGS